ncbi:hypothetical protein PCANC_14686 [Puccinia coronata f. sp. avenae]|uniref:Promethin n=1 Tax=Puccinia coronata f. sp. avenae TaxID=200324 RepID=A0A2N5SJB9_9BASI|nr:hypothetical protein PCASD_19600 [Puccinia coronata f. sp. avenae]PLW35444.1 hypothetical protein PCANC_14686 [Puccinia coronata f. sp. avenae]
MSNSVSGGIPEPKAQHSGIRRNGSLSTLYHRLMMAKYQIRVHVLIPLEEILKDAFRNYPTVTSYLMVLAGLSLIPILAFVGFSLFIGSILVGMGLTFVLTWGSVIIGSAFFALLASLAFLAAASFWIVLGLFVTIFAARLAYNLQKNVAEKFRHSKVVKELYNHAHEKRLHQQQQNGLDEKVA